jgi:hypothetical protein
MTLKPYSPEMLDHLALRLLDLAAMVREMAIRCRQHEISDLALHDKKPNAWCQNLERWARKAQAELEMKVIEARASRRAISSPE